jgi:hypothetical protein
MYFIYFIFFLHSVSSISIPLHKTLNKLSAKRSYSDLTVYASSTRAALHNKYGKPIKSTPNTRRKLKPKLKRDSGSEYLVNIGQDSEYVGQIQIGTPPQNFFVIFGEPLPNIHSWTYFMRCIP